MALMRRAAGRVIAIASSAVSLALIWVFLFHNPYHPVPLDSPGLVPWLTVPACLAIVASVFGWGTLLMVLGAVAFLPLGLYLMLTPGIFFWMGPASIGYVVAGILLRPRKEPTAG